MFFSSGYARLQPVQASQLGRKKSEFFQQSTVATERSQKVVFFVLVLPIPLTIFSTKWGVHDIYHKQGDVLPVFRCNGVDDGS